MAAVLKKRALAEYSQVVHQDEGETSKHKHHKKLRLSPKKHKHKHRSVSSDHRSEPLKSTSSDELVLILREPTAEACVPREVLRLFVRHLKQRNTDTSVQQLYKKLFFFTSDVKEEVVTASLLGVFKRLVENEELQKELDIPAMIEDILTILAGQNESNIIRAEGVDAIHRIYQIHPIILTGALSQKVIANAKHLLLIKSNHLVKRQCLSLLSDLAPIGSDIPSSSRIGPSTSDVQISSECIVIMKLLRDFSHYHDSRVRSAALDALLHLHKRGAHLDISLYSEFCEALSDDYEGCRITAIKLLEVLSHLYGDCLVMVSGGDEQIRLADDAFAKVCSMVNDLSMEVRTHAAGLMGKFTHVSAFFLDQTLDKKLMSNLRKKKTAHERSRDNYVTGEWSSGKKWASDAPQGDVCPDQVNLMEIGACGAFVHGLEDEFLEVRMATLESLSLLAQHFPKFAHQSLDFLVDMFNDEIEEIRLKAIQCLTQITKDNIILREDQVEIILAALKDNSIDIREALHEMLSNCQVASKEALRSCVEDLIENLKKYPQDRVSIWLCFKKLGSNHPQLTEDLVPELLGIHAFLDLPEPSLEDPAHLCMLFLVFNAAATRPRIINMFEHYTARHYAYLRDAHPDLVPALKGMDKDEDARSSLTIRQSSESSQQFLYDIFQRIRTSTTDDTVEVHTSVIELSIRDLQRLGEVDATVHSACDLLSQYLTCQMSLRKILVNNNWINAFLLSALQSSVFRSSLQQILVTTFRLNHQFHGIHPTQSALIQQTRVKALALQLMAIIHGSNASALALCDAFLEELESSERHLDEQNLKPDPLTAAMIHEINSLDEPKPGSVARILQPLFLSTENLTTQLADLSLMVNDDTLPTLANLRMSSATISEPVGKPDVPLKFTAGLVLCVRMDAIVRNIADIRHVRIKIKYPDQQTHVVLPQLSDFRVIDHREDSQVQNYRLFTNIYLTHNAWTEACHAEVGLVLDFRDTSTSALSVSQLWAAKTGSYIGQNFKSDSLIVDLCKPVNVYLLPKPPKKGVL